MVGRPGGAGTGSDDELSDPFLVRPRSCVSTTTATHRIWSFSAAARECFAS